MTGDELIKLLEPAVEGLGYELADVEVKIGSRDGVVRVFIDKPPGGVGMEDCVLVSRQISALLDVEDPIPGNYSLEVSSPGLDRRLKKVEHFQRFTGENVKIKLRFPKDGRRNYSGQLASVADQNIEVVVDGESHTLAIATIESARLVPTL